MKSSFMSQETVNITFFTDRYARNSFFTGESVCLHSMDYLFDSGSLAQTHVKPTCKHFFSKTCFSVNFTHSPVNYTWFGLLSYQRFDDRPLFKHFCDIEIISAIKQFQTTQNLHLWEKKFWVKKMYI